MGGVLAKKEASKFENKSNVDVCKNIADLDKKIKKTREENKVKEEQKDMEKIMKYSFDDLD
jgi:hypothetical protein